jgi:hypothetical protein
MRLTWKDAVSSALMAAIVVIYAEFLNSTTLWLISSARGTATAVLVLGIVACGRVPLPSCTRAARRWAMSAV